MAINSPRAQLTIRSRKIHTPEGWRDGTVVVYNGKVAGVVEPGLAPDAERHIDAGDKPEFTLYLPGRGGNLRLGFKTTAGTKWLFEAAQVTTRYRPGEMLYAVRDPLLGAEGVLNVAVLALSDSEGLAVSTTQQYDDEVPAGHVISSEPSTGATVKKGDDIRVVVSASILFIIVILVLITAFEEKRSLIVPALIQYV